MTQTQHYAGLLTDANFWLSLVVVLAIIYVPVGILAALYGLVALEDE